MAQFSFRKSDGILHYRPKLSKKIPSHLPQILFLKTKKHSEAIVSNGGPVDKSPPFFTSGVFRNPFGGESWISWARSLHKLRTNVGTKYLIPSLLGGF